MTISSSGNREEANSGFLAFPLPFEGIFALIGVPLGPARLEGAEEFGFCEPARDACVEGPPSPSLG
jgi:hypothetical protein